MIYKDLQKELPTFKVEKITEDNAKDVEAILKNNKYYIEKTQNHPVTVEEAIEDITALPPKKEMCDKTYALIYNESGKAVAVVDFLEKYPDNDSGFLGLFIINALVHHKGFGKKILAAIEKVCKLKGFSSLFLGCYLENAKGLAFWKSQGFCEVERMPRTIDNLNLTLVKFSKNI